MFGIRTLVVHEGYHKVLVQREAYIDLPIIFIVEHYNKGVLIASVR